GQFYIGANIRSVLPCLPLRVRLRWSQDPYRVLVRLSRRFGSAGAWGTTSVARVRLRCAVAWGITCAVLVPLALRLFWRRFGVGRLGSQRAGVLHLTFRSTGPPASVACRFPPRFARRRPVTSTVMHFWRE